MGNDTITGYVISHTAEGHLLTRANRFLNIKERENNGSITAYCYSLDAAQLYSSQGEAAVALAKEVNRTLAKPQSYRIEKVEMVAKTTFTRKVIG